LNAYVAAGIRSDHECTGPDEAREKLRRGMHILIREGTTARNLSALLPLVTRTNAHLCHFCTDDRHPDTLLHEGHIDDLVRKAIAEGLDPVTAIQMATINTAEHYGLRTIGAIAPAIAPIWWCWTTWRMCKSARSIPRAHWSPKAGAFSPNPLSRARCRSDPACTWIRSLSISLSRQARGRTGHRHRPRTGHHGGLTPGANHPGRPGHLRSIAGPAQDGRRRAPSSHRKRGLGWSKEWGSSEAQSLRAWPMIHTTSSSLAPETTRCALPWRPSLTWEGAR